MQALDDNDKLERTASQLSTASRKSSTVKAISRKQSIVTPQSAKTLESFPSLPAETSPGATSSPAVDAQKSLPHFDVKTQQKGAERDQKIVEKLIRSSPSLTGRTALFTDSRKISGEELPGALHHASDEHIRGLVKRTGAVKLVRQFAQDLAERDAEITSLRRKAEARERELKKMLREVEVSNADIEKRLHKIEAHADGGLDQRSPSSNNGLRVEIEPGVPAGGQSHSQPEDLGDMLGEAMGQEVSGLEIDDGYLDVVGNEDRQATLKARQAPRKGSDEHSLVSSVDSNHKPRGTLRGWKDYIWSGTNNTSRKTSKTSSVISDGYDEADAFARTRSSSGQNGRKTVLEQDIFQPPDQPITPSGRDLEPRSRKSSTSVASWTMKLFAGNTNGGRELDKQGTVRSRSTTRSTQQSRTSRSGSIASGATPRTARAALMKVSSMEGDPKPTRKASQPQSFTSKSGAKSPVPPVPPLPTSPIRTNTAATLGPVEMDTIHPPDTKPPTLLQSHERTEDDLLTDRYGFIYDQRRRKREAEISNGQKQARSEANAQIELISSSRASMKSPEPDFASQRSVPASIGRPDTPMSNDEDAEERPVRRWQDYLKVATFPTELLSHTPAAKPASAVVSYDDSSSVPSQRIPSTGEPRSSLPSIGTNAGPEMSPVNADKAEIAGVSLNGTANESAAVPADTEPVKLLLTQLTEVHDMLQRDKTVKWNEFLRKVRAERRREGEAAAASSDGKAKQAPEVMLTDGEVIGVSGLGNKGKVGRAKWKEFKQLVLGGIPVAYRAKIWSECSGASALRVPGYYDDLLHQTSDDPSVTSQIQMDIHRTLTDNIFFRKGPGVVKLEEVLLAYSRRNSDVGYCQGMNLIAGSLLLIMPTAEDAFWVLTSVVETILPQHYYDQSLLASRADQQVLRSYVSEVLPRLSSHLDELGIELEALTFQWFLSVFTDCLSAEALFRVWDVIFCFNDGSTFLFQVALALLKLNENQLLECHSAARVYGYIGNEMTDHAISIDGLVHASEALKNVVTRREVEERRWRALEEARGRERSKSTAGGAGGKRGSRSTTVSNKSSRELRVQEPKPYEGEGEVAVVD